MHPVPIRPIRSVRKNRKIERRLNETKLHVTGRHIERWIHRFRGGETSCSCRGCCGDGNCAIGEVCGDGIPDGGVEAVVVAEVYVRAGEGTVMFNY